MNIKRQTSAV